MEVHYKVQIIEKQKEDISNDNQEDQLFQFFLLCNNIPSPYFYHQFQSLRELTKILSSERQAELIPWEKQYIATMLLGLG